MRLLKTDLRHGEVKLVLESPDDLWELSKLLTPGSIVHARTFRKVEIKRGEESVRGERRSVFLGVRAEKIEFHETTGNLRVTGKIVEGPEDMSGYHTISLEAGYEATIRKEWKGWEVQRLREARIKVPKVLVCVLDDEEATIALVQKRIDVLAELRGPGSGKEGGERSRKEYFGDIISILKGKEADKIIIAGPGFVKEELFKELQKEMKGKVTMDTTAHTGTTGVQEMIKRGGVQRVVKESRAALETQEIEKFFEGVAKGGKVEYGKKQVTRAMDNGAVEKLLICESLLRENEELLKRCEEMGGEVMVISEGHEAGERLKGIGGIAAFLRFKA